ncbi:hypothetical protein ACWCQ1_51615 [Streptomyces sp. NPDC002144]
MAAIPGRWQGRAGGRGVSGRDGTEGGGFLADETPGNLLRRSMPHVTPLGASAEHARLVVQIWAEASTSEELAAVCVSRHTALRDHLAGLYARNREGDAGGAEPTAADSTWAEAALAAVIGYAIMRREFSGPRRRRSQPYSR